MVMPNNGAGLNNSDIKPCYHVIQTAFKIRDVGALTHSFGFEERNHF
jgi:hypothetical protein